MTSKTQEEARLNDYLLGENSEDERERLEEEYFANDEAFQQVLSAEDDLIDAYARGELSAKERRRFEGTFLATERGRERVQFARSLAGAVADTRAAAATLEQAPPPPRTTFFGTLRTRGPMLRFALTAASLVMALGLTWLFVERARLREELRQLRAERTALSEKAQEMERRAAAEQVRSAEVLAQLEAERAQPTPESEPHKDEAVARQSSPRAGRPPRRQSPKDDVATARRTPGRGRKSPLLNTEDATVSGSLDSRRREQLPLKGRNVLEVLSSAREPFVLTPGLVRGGGSNTLEVLGDAAYIRLRLNLETESPHETYRAVIETVDRRPVWRIDSFKPDQAGGGAAINLPPVPARALPPGDYTLTLSGRRADDSFEGVADYSFRVVRK